MDRLTALVFRSKPRLRPLHPQRWLAAALVLAASAPAAQAASIGFEDRYGTLLSSGDSLQESGLRVSALAADGSAGLVGAVLDSTDYNVCSNLACPVNVSGNYYAAVNDGSVLLSTTLAGGTFRLASFDASFIGAQPIFDVAYPPVAGLLLLVGRDASGASLQETYSLAGPGLFDFGFSFARFSTSAAFASHDFTSITLTGFSCDAGATCSTYSNLAQFGLDNLGVSVGVSAVPEPSAVLLMLAGLAGIAVALRRRSPGSALSRIVNGSTL